MGSMNADEKINVSGGLRTSSEKIEGQRYEELFNLNPCSWQQKMENFPNYIRRQNLTRFLVLYEIFKKILTVKGSIIECGVNHGFGISTWCKLSAILEPVNLTRRVYGFDTFDGFPSLSNADISRTSKHVKKGDLAADSYEELMSISKINDSTRFLGHVPKLHLIKGNAITTIPQFIEDNPHVIVSLLYLDFDLSEPTKIALEYFLPRMPKGSIIAFDELDNPLWPGETQAMVECFENNKLQIERFPFDPYVGYAIVD